MRNLLAGTAAVGLALLLVPATCGAETVNGSGLSVTVDCNGGNAAVNGSSNRVVFRGHCRTLRVAGASNRVDIDLAPGGAIEVVGAGNSVVYEPVTPAPAVSALGIGNEIHAGAAATALLPPAVPDGAPPAPIPVVPPGRSHTSTIVLGGDGEDNDVLCTGCDVLVHGSHSRYRLRGGLQSVTVEGNADQIQAELEPGARVSISGDGVTLTYTLNREGAAPAVSITGSGNQVIRAQ